MAHTCKSKFQTFCHTRNKIQLKTWGEITCSYASDLSVIKVFLVMRNISLLSVHDASVDPVGRNPILKQKSLIVVCVSAMAKDRWLFHPGRLRTSVPFDVT